MIPLDLPGVISVWDTTGTRTQITEVTYEDWLRVEQGLRDPQGVLSFTISGTIDDPYKFKQVQFGRNQVVRAEFEAQK